MISKSQEQYNKIINQNNIVQVVNQNNKNYTALFEQALPLQQIKQERLLLDKIKNTKVKQVLLKYLSLKQVQEKIQILANRDESVLDLKQTFRFFKNIKRDSLKYKSFLQKMQEKVKNNKGLTLSNDYIDFLRIASKCHKPKRNQWKMKIQTKPQLICQNCGRDIVNKPGQHSHQKACPSIKRDNMKAKNTSIKKTAAKLKTSKKMEEQSEYQE